MLRAAARHAPLAAILLCLAVAVAVYPPGRAALPDEAGAIPAPAAAAAVAQAAAVPLSDVTPVPTEGTVDDIGAVYSGSAAGDTVLVIVGRGVEARRRAVGAQRKAASARRSGETIIEDRNVVVVYRPGRPETDSSRAIRAALRRIPTRRGT